MQCEPSSRRALLVRLSGALLVLDATDTIGWAEDSAATLLGWSAGDLVGKPVAVLLPGWTSPRTERSGDATSPGPAAEQPACTGARALLARRQDGGQLPVVVITGPAPDGGHCLLVNREASEPRAHPMIDDPALPDDPAAEAQLRQRVGATAHELGNLIGVVGNYAALLARGLREQQAQADLDQIRTAAQRSSGLVRELAALADGRER